MKKIVSGVFALVMMSASAQAAEWNFYGSAQVNTFYTDVDNANAASAKTLSHGLNGESGIGAEVKVSDAVSGMFEYGSENGAPNLRYLYGVWNFGAGALLVGQDDGTLAHPGSDQVYSDNAGLGGWGEMASGKKAQVKLIFDSFRIAFRAPDANYNDGTSNVTTNTTVKMPAVAARYDFAGNNWNLALTGGYSRFTVGTTNEQTVSSYVAGIGGDINVGAFVFSGNIFGGENVGNLVDADVNGGDTGNGYALYSSGKVSDNEAFAWKVTMTYAFNDRFSFHAGYGYMETELENAVSEDDVQSYYAQLPIALASGVSIIPEIGVVDYKQDTAENKTTYFGAKWQIDF